MKRERRASPRLAVAVSLAVHDLRGGEQAAAPVTATVTDNVSAGGVYFRTSSGEGFEVGMKVGVQLTMPHHALPAPRHVSLSLVGEGTVVRIESVAGPEDAWWGVAIQFDQPLRFENLELA